MRAERGDKQAALVFVVWFERQATRRQQQVEQLVDAAQVAEGVQHGRQDVGVVAPAGAAMQGHAALARALAIVSGTAGEAAIGQVRVDAASMAREVGAGRAGGFVDGEIGALVEGQADTAERHAGRAIGGKVRQIGLVAAVRGRAGPGSCGRARQF